MTMKVEYGGSGYNKWLRIFDDINGTLYMEQYGRITGASIRTINFPANFPDANWTMAAGAIKTTTSNFTPAQMVTLRSRGASSCSIRVTNGAGQARTDVVLWKAVWINPIVFDETDPVTAARFRTGSNGNGRYADFYQSGSIKRRLMYNPNTVGGTGFQQHFYPLSAPDEAGIIANAICLNASIMGHCTIRDEPFNQFTTTYIWTIAYRENAVQANLARLWLIDWRNSA